MTAGVTVNKLENVSENYLYSKINAPGLCIIHINTNQRTDSPKSLLACKVLMECCVSSMQFYTIHAKKIDDIPMLPILYHKMELYGIYQASGHCTS